MKLSATRVLTVYAGILTLAITGLIQAFYVRQASVAAFRIDNDGVIHARGLVVEDTSGRERVRLGAPLPNPLKNGIRVERRGSVSGILITDATGTERGGYVTEEHGEAFLTLDSQKGQEMTLLSNAKGGVNFDIADPKGNEAAITVFPEGPRFLMRKANRAVTDLPFYGNVTSTPRQ